MSINKIFGDGGAKKSMKKANKASAAQEAVLKRQAALYDELLKVGQEEREYYKKNYRPVEEQMIKTAGAGVKPDYEGITNLGGQASQEVGRQFDVARGSAVRELTRRGVTVGSGQMRSLRTSTALAEAGAKAGAFTRANIEEADKRRTERKYADETTYNRRRDVTGVGRGVQALGTQRLSAAAGGLTSVAGGYGSQADRYRDLAAEQGNAAGGAIGNLINAGIKIYGISQGVPPIPA